MEEVAARGVQIFLALTLAYLLALWFALAVWAYRDIGNRSQNAITQIFSTLLVVLFSVPGALLYLLLRPKATLDEVYQRSLEEEYLIQDLQEFPACHSCQRPVEEDFVICPHCQAALKEPCPSCERLIQIGWTTCPYCGQLKTERLAAISERAPVVQDRYLERGSGSFRTIGSGSVREVAGPPQPDMIASSPDPGAIEAGSQEGEPDGPPVSDVEPIRLFDRRKTRMRKEAATETASEPSPSSLNAADLVESDLSIEGAKLPAEVIQTEESEPPISQATQP